MKNLLKLAQPAIIFALFGTTIVFGGFLLLTHDAQAQYGSSCSDYGIMAYESGGYCKCMSGYVMGEGVLGNSYCISETQACQDQYGFNARANYSGGCECGYGYVFGKNYSGQTQCVSGDSACHDEYGIMSRYDSLSDTCECSYGYIFDTNMFGDQQCTNANQVCRSDHGYRSSYDSLSNKCECDSGYTFDDDYQCVEKQNNVYFKLLDINPENDKELLIKSDYDYSKYIVRVGVGCLSTSIERYRGKNLVVNLGTDYSVDTFDTVVLQDHSQTCSIMHKEKTYDDSFPEPEEEEDYSYYFQSTQTYTPPQTTPKQATVEQEVQTDETLKEEVPRGEQEMIDEVETTEVSTSSDTDTNQEDLGVVKESFFKKIISFFKSWF
ncbi:hypothetical protein H6788_02100 [Candidatus Nomurabacteria bacterium]|nr:hypothetical protein [Candidatus Nomurabacteria bacterium]